MWSSFITAAVDSSLTVDAAANAAAAAVTPADSAICCENDCATWQQQLYQRPHTTQNDSERSNDGSLLLHPGNRSLNSSARYF